MNKDLSDKELLAAAVAVAGDYKELAKRSGLSRQVFWRLSTGCTKLMPDSKARLHRVILNAK